MHTQGENYIVEEMERYINNRKRQK
ncbi:MAG: hypothetical protein LBT76_02625 [Tannerella sp.]|nr:hypothetical protein [Tannerella sp.]